MIFTARQKYVVRAALSYALSNADDLNAALAGEPSGDGTDDINVGGIDGLRIEEGEVPALIGLFEPQSRPPSEGRRTFAGTLLVAIDQREADENDGDGPVIVDDLSDFLDGALTLDVDTEDDGNPVGFQSAELLFDTLEELAPADVRRLDGK